MFHIISTERQSDMLESCLVLGQCDAIGPTIQKVVVKRRERMGRRRRPTTPTQAGRTRGRGSWSRWSAGCTSCTRPSGGKWGAPGLPITSVQVCRTTSRKGTIIVNSIQMSIIFT